MPRSVTAFRLALAACLLLPLLAHAAGLGRLTVQSAIGQPLRAEVAVVSLQAGEADALTARIASPEAFRLAGIEFSSSLLSVRVSVERRDGKPVLMLSSSQPINEPFVELLIELQWATGRLVREYTFLLDPVEYKPPQPLAAAPVPAPAPVAIPKPVAAPPVVAKPLAAEPKASGSYQVKKGDTLSKVARENKLDGVSVNQMLVALYQSNQSAFIRNNMYLMRSGHVLKIPERAAAVAITSAEATRMVRAQSVEFDEYRRNLGASVAARPAKPAAPAERAMPGRITPKAAEPSPRDAKDRIKLSKVDSAKTAAPVARAAAEDDKASLNRALKESQSRVADLEKQLTDLKKLVEMKNQQLALLEKKAAVPPAAVAPKPVPEAPKPASAPVKPVAEAPKPAAPAPAAEAAKPAAPAAPKPATEPVKAKAAPAPPPPSLVDEFIENPLALGGLGGVVVLLVGYGAWAWRRKKSAQSRSGGFSAIAAASEAARAAPPPPDKSAAEAALAQVQAAAATAAVDEVDPIAEADVYLAYGRDAQAETILKDALASNPDRLVVHVKLLDIYAQRRDAASFEKTALKVKGLSGGAGPEWDKAMSLGRSIDPENGLYGAGAAAEAPKQPASAAPPGVDFDILGGPAPARPAAPDSVDFDIGASTAEMEAPAKFKPGDTVVLSAADMQAASSQMDFDIGATTQEAPAAKPAPAAPAPEEAPSSLDFNLDFDLGEAKPAAAPAAAPTPDISSINLDLGAPGEAPPAAGATSKWQEVATKLDLAKAYEEMGDKDGARELLNEVLSEGDAAQQEEAKRMLAKLG